MAVQPKEGSAPAPGGELFVRRASGLTRVVSPWSALVYAFVCPTMTFAFLYYFQLQTLYLGSYGWLTSWFILFLLPIVSIYVFMSMSMPRSGGEYIYVSRILSPLLGFIASWTLTIVGINWAGLLSQWLVNWGIGNFFLTQGLAAQNDTLIRWGQYFSVTTPENRFWIWIIATIALVSTYGVMAMGTKAVMRAMWAVLVVTWAMLITYVVVLLTVGGEANAIAGFEKLQGVRWDEVRATVDEMTGGMGLPAYGVAVTVWAGLVFVNLSTLGSTFASNISGEIKKVNVAMPLAQLGSIFLFVVYWVIFSLATDFGFGTDTVRSLALLESEGKASELINTYPLFSYMIVWLTQNWFLVALAGPIGWLVATWGGMLGLAFGPVRNLFAFSFDGILPAWMNKVSKNGSPNRCVLVAFLISWTIATISTYTTWWSYIVYTVTIWMVGWLLLSIAAIAFPWRRKDIYEKSPQLVQSKLLGIPVVTILGVLGAIVASASIYATFLVGTTPTMNVQALGYTALVFVLLPIVIYFIALTVQRRKGVPMDLRFKSVPPD